RQQGRSGIAVVRDRASGTPCVGGRVVEFRAGEKVTVPNAAYDKDLAGWQQCRGVKRARFGERTGWAPGVGRRVVEFGVNKGDEGAVLPSGHEDFARRQQRGGVPVAPPRK